MASLFDKETGKTWKLCGSAATVEKLEPGIVRFYYGTKMRIRDDMQVQRVSDGKILDGVRVVKKGKRFRFEILLTA